MFKCDNEKCEHTDRKFFGICPYCKEGVGVEYEEESINSINKFSKKNSKNNKQSSIQKPIKIQEVSNDFIDRFKTFDSQLDNVFGGGVTKNSVNLISGEPGVGKSTLLLQLIAFLKDRTLYLSGEESDAQIKSRHNRLKLNGDFDVLNDTNLSNLMLFSEKYDNIVIDSINTMYVQEVDGSPGGVSQIKASTHLLMELAKRLNKTIFIVGQINKDGSVAGPKTLEHMVDTVLSFENFDEAGKYKILSPVKNRFGSLLDTAIYQMEELGLVSIQDPSMILIDDEETQKFGSAISLIQKGKRPFFINIEALVDETSSEKTFNQSIGFEQKRLIQVLTIMSKYLKFYSGDKNVFLNIAGKISLKQGEGNNIDLAAIVAILSSCYELPVDKNLIFLGEVGLNGSIRASGFEKDFIKFAKGINPDFKIICKTTNFNHISDIFNFRDLEFKF